MAGHHELLDFAVKQFGYVDLVGLESAQCNALAPRREWEEGMSTYYAAVCEIHQVRCDAFSIGLCGGVAPVGDSKALFAKFLTEHAGCRPRIVSEHEDDYFNEHYVEFSDDVR